MSLFDLIKDPSWLHFGYLIWDAVSAILPFIPGSYVAKGGKIVCYIAGKTDDLRKGIEFLTGSYNKLKSLFRGIDGVEIHHLVEKRFSILFSSKAGDFLSIPLTSEFHQVITNRWRNLYKISDDFALFKYGSDYSKITYDQMKRAIEEVYHDMPGVLEEVLAWFEKNWRKKS